MLLVRIWFLGIVPFGVIMVAAMYACGDAAQQATGILRTYCYECHGAEHKGQDENYDVSNLAYLRQAGYAIPGNPGASKIMRKIASGAMPPEGQPRPSAAEVNLIEQWIREGATDPGAPAPGQSADSYVLSHILADLRASVDGQARNYRYFSLTNVPQAALAQYHAALAKALNSLTLETNITLPEAVDEAGKLLKIDQRDYGWNDAQWQRVLDAYPYFEAPAYVRADWFIATALKPPIYYDLLGLPNNERDLERLLGIDSRSNSRGSRTVRAGVLNSGVAFHNRVLERHPTRFGAYWKSYDFASSDARQNILRFPLGPRGIGFDDEAFQQNGTEIIFTLPNGLHGYYVANAQGQRLDAAPTNIVADRHKVAGTLDIQPGLSCIACHSQGIQDKFTDSVRLSANQFGRRERNRILSLYVDQQRMQAYTSYDKARYLQAVAAVTGETQEPIGGVALKYQEPLSIATAAAEVGGSVQQVTTAIGIDRELREVLLPLRSGQTIQRAVWESKEQGQSPAQRLADLLRN